METLTLFKRPVRANIKLFDGNINYSKLKDESIVIRHDLDYFDRLSRSVEIQRIAIFELGLTPKGVILCHQAYEQMVMYAYRKHEPIDPTLLYGLTITVGDVPGGGAQVVCSPIDELVYQSELTDVRRENTW